MDKNINEQKSLLTQSDQTKDSKNDSNRNHLPISEYIEKINTSNTKKRVKRLKLERYHETIMQLRAGGATYLQISNYLELHANPPIKASPMTVRRFVLRMEQIANNEDTLTNA